MAKQRNLSTKGKQILINYGKILPVYLMEKEYNQNFLSERDLAEKYNIPRQWLKLLREKYKIKPLRKNERAAAKNPNQLTQEQHNLVMGLLLGTGSIYGRERKTPTKPNSYFKVTSHIIYGDFIDFVSKKLQNFQPRIYQEKLERKSRVYQRKGISTGTSPVWNAYRELFYGTEKKKRWDDMILSKISSPVLVFWFLNSGGFYLRENQEIIFIKTWFKKENANLLPILNNLGFEFNFRKRKNRLYLDLNPDQNLSFINWISTHKCDLPTRKIPRTLRDLNNPLWAQKLPKFKGLWEKAKKDSKELPNVLEELNDIYDELGFPFPYLSQHQIEMVCYKLKTCDSSSLIKDNNIYHNVRGIKVATNFYPHFWQARTRKNKTITEIFLDRNLRKKILENRLKHGIGFHPSQLLIGMGFYTKSPANYPPFTARAIYERFLPPEGGHLLDPCAGYGGRLLGALASDKVLSYRGIDPSERSVKSAQQMIKDISQVYGKDPANYKVVRDTAENWNPQAYQSYYDLVFTSPPYFDQEEYAEDPLQVSQTCKTWQDYERWCRSVVQNWINLLKPLGHIVLHVSDTYLKSNERIPVVSAWNAALNVDILKHLPQLTYIRPAGRGKQAQEQILVYQKTENAVVRAKERDRPE